MLPLIYSNPHRPPNKKLDEQTQQMHSDPRPRVEAISLSLRVSIRKGRSRAISDRADLIRSASHHSGTITTLRV